MIEKLVESLKVKELLDLIDLKNKQPEELYSALLSRISPKKT